jgi:hypothetical protein
VGSYQDLEDWTKLLLRKIKRSVQEGGPATELTSAERYKDDPNFGKF